MLTEAFSNSVADMAFTSVDIRSGGMFRGVYCLHANQ